VPAAPAVPGLRPAAGPDSPAIVFFTTGTTGTPRGVISPHRATTRLVRDATAWTGPGRIMAQTAPASGDTYSLEVWVTLAAGGACAIPGDGGHPTPARLRSLVRGCSVDTVFLTTSLLNRLMDEDPGCLSGLRTVLTGGERMSVHHVRLCRLTHPGLEIVNCYGPAGNGVLATVRTVRPQDLAAAGGVPLGTAVSATGLHILNGQDPAPPGGTGEICLSGGGLALGYLGDPWLTAERFPTVSLGGPATRIHRTGDRGALGADGVLRFQGRDRRQVTIGGRRIDPQETEDAARRLPGVTECVVLPVYGERETDTRLALFYTASAALTADTAAADTCAAADADAADLTAADTGTGTGGGPDLSPAGVRRALAAVLPAPLVP
ncbi:AMP-binding protein, partial [Streptomyces clavuligerus]